MTTFSKNLGGHGPFAPPWLRLCARGRSVFFSYQVMVLEDSSHIRYWWSCLAKQVLHLKLHWNV